MRNEYRYFANEEEAYQWAVENGMTVTADGRMILSGCEGLPAPDWNMANEAARWLERPPAGWTKTND